MTVAGSDASGAEHVEVLGASVQRLREFLEALPEDALTASAYPTEWTCADVLSHLGSGAVITHRRVEDTLAGRQTPDDHAPGVWEEWNAKTPLEQRDDALAADASLVALLERVPEEQRRVAEFAMGPMSLSFATFVGMRLNEHAFHTWDIEVTRDPGATIPARAAALVVDNLELVARFTARPSPDRGARTVNTTDPARAFVIDLSDVEGSTLRRIDVPERAADLALPAEAFARLVYGRLDGAHTPAFTGSRSVLDDLRQVFPGP